MNCFQCKKEIENEYNSIVTPPDGDSFHKDCYSVFEKEREIFFNNIASDEWYKKNYPELNKDE